MESKNSQEGEGKFIDGYEIVKTLGRGSFGKVKLGIHPETGKQVAIKILLDISEEALNEVKDEITAFKKLPEHKNVVNYISHGPTKQIKLPEKEEKDVWVFILELIVGGELEQVIENSPNGCLNEKLARYYFK